MSAKTFKDDSACADAIARVGEIRAELARIEAAKAEAVANASADAEQKATPLQEEAAELTARIRTFCEEDRARLTDNHRTKTAQFKTGSVSWRQKQPRLVIDPAMKDKIVAKLKQLSGFTRTKVEIDTAAVKKSLTEDKKSPCKRIKGLTLEPSDEGFEVKPTGAELAERRDLAA